MNKIGKDDEVPPVLEDLKMNKMNNMNDHPQQKQKSNKVLPENKGSKENTDESFDEINKNVHKNPNEISKSFPPIQDKPKNPQQIQKPFSSKQEKWVPYGDAKNELAITSRFMFKGWYKFRNNLLSPFWVKIPLINKPIGTLIVMIILLGGFLSWSIIPLIITSDAPVSPPSVTLTITFVLATRNSVITFLTGMSYETQIILHKFASYVSVITGLIHGLDYIITEEFEGKTITGIILLSAMYVLVLTGIFFKFITRYFEWFLRIHYVFFIIVIGVGLAHGVGQLYTAIGFLAVDLFLRFFFMFLYKKESKETELEIIAENVMKLSFDKKKAKFNYKAGQYVFICIPSLTYIEFHPFTIDSSPNQDKVELKIKVLGDWTKDLKTLATKKKKVKVLIDGPYGTTMFDLEGSEFQVLLMISGGIGVTPMQSLTKDLLREAANGRPLKKIFFLWSGRQRDYIESVINVDEVYEELRDQEKTDQNEQLEMFLHLSKEKSLDFTQGLNCSQYKKSCVKIGRPKLDEYFRKVNKYCKASNVSKVGVMMCGPSTLMSFAKMKTNDWNGKDGVTYRYHFETFDFLDEII